MHSLTTRILVLLLFYIPKVEFINIIEFIVGISEYLEFVKNFIRSKRFIDKNKSKFLIISKILKISK